MIQTVIAQDMRGGHFHKPKKHAFTVSRTWRRLLSAPRGSRFSTWLALRGVQAATRIGRIGLESVASAALLMSALGQKQTSETHAHNVLCGWLPECKDFLMGWRFGRVQSCVRPVDAVYMTAGLDGFRGSGPTLLCGL